LKKIFLKKFLENWRPSKSFPFWRWFGWIVTFCWRWSHNWKNASTQKRKCLSMWNISNKVEELFLKLI